MSKFTLLGKNPDTGNYFQLQDKCACTLEEAREFADSTESVNGNRFEIVVAEFIMTTGWGEIYREEDINILAPSKLSITGDEDEETQKETVT